MSDPPGTLAKMLHYLAPRKSWRVMEIGTGSGYSTAVLSSLVREVVTVEFHESLALGAKERLARLRVKNVRFFAGEGTDREELLGPFDGILVLAACQKRPLSLVRSLKEKGVMVFPMGPIHQQQIIILRNESPDDREVLFKVEYRELCSFTPLRGPYGWL
jgi:protein-L-isoaspartate(D-aspartate) O-methyltransferase